MVEITPKHEMRAEDNGARSVCVHCRTETRVVLVDKRAVRQYRREGGTEWLPEVLCTRPAEVAPPPPQNTTALTAATAWDEDALVFGDGERHRLGDIFQPEAIGGHLVQEAAQYVDLDVAFSPVLFRYGSRAPSPVTMLDGGKYRVCLSDDDATDWRGAVPSTDVTADDLRVMRARYLLTRDAIFRELPKMPPRLRAMWERLYFPGGVFVPAQGSRLASIEPGKPLTVKLKDGQTHRHAIAELLVEAGAASESLRVVFAGDDGQMMAAPLVPEDMPIPGPPPAPEPVPCGQCGAPTPGGICDNCIETASRIGLDLSTVKGHYAGESRKVSLARWKRDGRDLKPPAPPAEPALLEVPRRATLNGAHSEACDAWKVNDMASLNVEALPAGLRLCEEHWARVKEAQGGVFRRFFHRDYAGGRYR